MSGQVVCVCISLKTGKGALARSLQAGLGGQRARWELGCVGAQTRAPARRSLRLGSDERCAHLRRRVVPPQLSGQGGLEQPRTTLSEPKDDFLSLLNFGPSSRVARWSGVLVGFGGGRL